MLILEIIVLIYELLAYFVKVNLHLNRLRLFDRILVDLMLGSGVVYFLIAIFVYVSDGTLQNYLFLLNIALAIPFLFNRRNMD